jgi:hypothetical protein
LRIAREDNHPLRRESETAESRAPWRRRRDAIRSRSDEPAEDGQPVATGWWQAITARR